MRDDHDFPEWLYRAVSYVVIALSAFVAGMLLYRVWEVLK